MNAADKIAAARVRVVNQRPYFASVLFGLRPVEKKGIGTLAVDKGLRLYYDPAFVETTPDIELAGVVVHEIGHILRDHSGRCGDRNHEKWNRAGDAEINDDLLVEGWKLPNGVVTPASIGCEDHRTAEEYYARMPDDDGNDDSDNGGEKDRVEPKCGGCSGNPQPWEDDEEGSETGIPAKDEAETEVARRQVARAVKEHAEAHGRGSVPQDLIDWADAKLEPPKIDWRRQLAAILRGTISAQAGQVDYTHSRISRRYHALRSIWGRAPVLPALYQPKPKVCVVLDQSGSMASTIEEAVAEVQGIAKAVGSDVEVVETEMAVRRVSRVRGSDASRLARTGGGTDMRPGIDEAVRRKADVVVVVTDCMTPWPESCPKRMIVVATSPAESPSWAKRVEVSRD